MCVHVCALNIYRTDLDFVCVCVCVFVSLCKIEIIKIKKYTHLCIAVMLLGPCITPCWSWWDWLNEEEKLKPISERKK